MKDSILALYTLLFTCLLFILIIYLIWNNNIFGLDFNSIKIPFQ